LFLLSNTSVLCQGIPFIDSLEEAVLSQGPELVDIDIISQLAMRYTEVDPAKGLSYAQEAMELATNRGTATNLARAYNSVASNFLMLSQVDSSMHYFGRAAELYNETGEQKGRADILGNMGHVSYYIGDYVNALDYYFQALEVFEEIEHTIGIANQHLSIGSVYMVQEKYVEALLHDSIALKMSRDLGDTVSAAMVLGNIGNVYADLEYPDSALVYYSRASEIYRQQNLLTGLGRNLVGEAGMYIDLRKFDSALTYAQEALTICDQINFSMCVAYCIANIGEAYLGSYEHFDSTDTDIELIRGSRRSHLQSAIEYFELAIEQPIAILGADDMEYNHLHLGRAYRYDRQFEKAAEQFEKYAMIRDSIDAADRAAKIEQLTTEREIAVREKQIELDRLRLKVKRKERVYFIIGLALLAGLLIFIYRNYYNQRRSNIKLGVLNTEISDVNMQLESKNENLSLTLKELKETQGQLIESERQKENEIIRRRISQDIHDDISSGLTKISWMSELLKNQTQQENGVDTSVLDRIANYSRDTVSKLGEIIWSTKPESDNVTGFANYARDFLASYMDGADMKCHIDLPEDGQQLDMNPELRRNLFLVLKESVHNARKYSEATDLIVSMDVSDGKYQLIVEDNGVGIDSARSAGGRNGMKNMESRMRAVNGGMTVQSTPETGTRIEFKGQLY